MDALDLKLICASDTVLAKYFRGVFSRDNLPSKVVKYPSAFIVNTDISTGPGQHWVAVFFNKQKRCFYFDSYGGPPMNGLANFTLDNSVSDVLYNPRWFQGAATATCGLYVTHFLYHAARGMLLEAITGWPFEHLAWLRNEARIKRWARRMIAHSSGSI